MANLVTATLLFIINSSRNLYLKYKTKMKTTQVNRPPVSFPVSAQFCLALKTKNSTTHMIIAIMYGIAYKNATLAGAL